MLATVKKYIADHNLLRACDLHLVALSGGADSVALLLAMRQLGYRVEAVHCNFHLRGDESDRDMHFAEELCNQLDVRLHIAHFDTREYAALHRQSIELAARNLRYAYFENLRRDIAAADILVAHHRDDNVETLLMNLVRGTGMRGLAAIRPANKFIRRPLLCVSRQDIESYLAQANQAYVIDSTNLEDDATRNLFRHHVVPMLEQINPQASRNISQTAAYMADVCQFIDHALPAYIDKLTQRDKQTDTLTISIPQLLSMPSPHFLLYEIIKEYGYSSEQISDIFRIISDTTVATEKANTNVGCRRFLSQSHCAYIVKDAVVIRIKSDQPTEHLIPEPGLYSFDNYRLRINKSSYTAGQEIDKDKRVATFDGSLIQFPLTVRPWRQGDRFIPFGMRGCKLVSDYLTDAKIPVWEREQQTVVTDATGKIIWLTALRSANCYRVTVETHTIITLTIE